MKEKNLVSRRHALKSTCVTRGAGTENHSAAPEYTSKYT